MQRITNPAAREKQIRVRMESHKLSLESRALRASNRPLKVEEMIRAPATICSANIVTKISGSIAMISLSLMGEPCIWILTL